MRPSRQRNMQRTTPCAKMYDDAQDNFMPGKLYSIDIEVTCTCQDVNDKMPESFLFKKIEQYRVSQHVITDGSA